MWTAVTIIFCGIMVFECIFISIGNIFTIYVFWSHRKRLKRASILLINLAVADLFVGLTEPVGIATETIPRHFERDKLTKETTHDNMSTIIPSMFSYISLFCLVHISLERAYAVIWPLRHRVTSINSYICAIVFAWAAGISVAALLALNAFEMFIISYNAAMVPVCVIIFSSLVIISVSYLSIRRRLHLRRVPAIQRNAPNEEEQNIKLSKTLFIVIAASLVCWLPGSVSYFIYVFCDCAFPVPLLYSGTIFNIGSSIVNPVIYSFRMPIFKETLKRLKPTRMFRKNNVN